MATLLLIDGHSQAYRAYFALRTPLITRSGEPTTAVFGFTRRLLSLLQEYRPEYVAVAFDRGETWRHAEFEGYKATRERMPDEMRSQMERIEELLQAFNIPVVTYPDYEADDVLGTLARQAEERGHDVLILTGDRDMFQLASERTRILYTSGGPNPQTKPYGPAEVEERYGLTPQQFVELKALTGDTSDNIPGVPGVGDKTAGKFLQQYSTLENLYAHLDEVGGPKTRSSLEVARDLVWRNRRLVTIVTDVDVEFDAGAFRVRDYDPEAVRAIFEELEFRSLLDQLPPALGSGGQEEGWGEGQISLFGEEPNGAAAEVAAAGLPRGERSYPCVQDEQALAQVAQALQGTERIGFDVETTSTDAIQASLVGLGVGWEPGEAVYIPVGHVEGEQVAWPAVAAQLQGAFADDTKRKVAHNSKYDLIVCRQHGLELAGPIHDTMLMAWLLDSASRSLGLKDQAEGELGWKMTNLSELIGSGRKQITMDQVPIQVAGDYCGADVDATLRLFDILAARLQDAGMWRLYEEVELPLLPVLADMELAGVLLDVGVLGEMSGQLANRLAEIERDLFEVVGHGFNLRSTQQLSTVLFEEMAFPTQGMRKTRSGFFSTAAGELDKLAGSAGELSADQRKVLDLILEQRQLEKLRGTYVDALPALVNPETGRVHTSFNQAGASTGRLSSSNPNLQNIPIRTEVGREIRRAFVAPPGWLLLAADYSQVELRILAHVVQEAGLLEAFRQGLDIHAATASHLFGVPVENVDRAQRGLAKTINFATIYGVSAYGLSSRTDMGPQEAQRYLDQYFATYPKVQAYISDTIQKANTDGYVETLLGRKRFFPELKNPRLPHNQRQAVERAAINAPIQGTAADIIKIAMVRLHRELQAGDYAARMVLQVHDELVLEAPEHEQEDVVALVREVMESAYALDVPLKVDVEIGPNWYEMEKA